MSRRRDEQGVVAIMTAVLAVVLLVSASMAVDITSLSSTRQQLHDTVDTSALSGALLLPDAAAAQTQALAVAHDNDPDSSPAIAFYCIVGSMSTPPVVNPMFIPAACNPGPAPYVAGSAYPGLKCNASVCAIPCVPSQGDTCNAIEVADDKVTPFSLAPVIGIAQGTTGSLSAVACKGGCGTLSSNPVDIAVIADRTASMSPAAFSAVKSSVQEMLKVLTPSMHQVMFGMNSRSKASGTCVTDPASSTTAAGAEWFPIASGSSHLFKDYLSVTTPPTLNTSSLLVKGMQCMTQSSGLGTWIASPIDAAEEMLRTDPGRNPLAKKAIIYMTDGEPNENATRPRPATNRNTSSVPWGNTDLKSACTNAQTAATDAKADVMVITIAYDVSGVHCGGAGDPLVTTRLAAMAGPLASDDDGGDGPGGQPAGCPTAAAVASENADGDFFFCAAQPSDLASIFQAAAVTITGGSHLVWMP